MAKGHRPKAIRSVVVVSDLHCGCRLGLCPRWGATLDDGGRYEPSNFQRKMWNYWTEFWDKWVPQVTQGEPFALVVNGDALDGVHHNSTTQVSHNIGDQIAIARECLAPAVKRAASYFHVRGTEAHVGKSAEYEERLARDLGAIPNEEGQHARWHLLLELGGHTVSFAHHIGTSTSPFSKSSALQRETVRGYVLAGRWNDRPPIINVRSHRHVCSEVREPSATGWTSTVVTPGWQGMTPYTYRLGIGIEQPEFGGIMVRAGDEELYTRAKVWRIEGPQPVRL